MAGPVPAIYAALIVSLQFAIGTSFLVFRTLEASSEVPVESTAQALALWTTAALIMTVAVAYRGEAAQTTNGPMSPRA